MIVLATGTTALKYVLWVVATGLASLAGKCGLWAAMCSGEIWVMGGEI